MNQNEMRNIFDKVFNGNQNAMTPTVLKYLECNSDLICEVSTGTGIIDGSLYGVTIDYIYQFMR